MITAISITLYFVAAFCAAVAGHAVHTQPVTKAALEVKFFSCAFLIFFILAALLQIFG